VATALEDNHVRISITDSGTGIPEAVRNKIFDPFFTTKEVGKGTGQGLSMAYDIVVNKHGGTIFFDTEEGRGTTFHIRLPLGGGATT
jgi:signal transduction histidine kinase